MFRKLIPFLLLILLGGSKGYGQQDSAILNYINTYKSLAIEEMQRTGVPAAIKLAQGIHETQAGKSDLVLRSNNHFGIKCKTGWTGDRVYHDDDRRAECFRSYATAEDSWKDHSDFLKNNQRYASLFQLDPTDYKAWAYGLKKAGYATNTKYPELLIRLIETYDLEKYTLIAMGKLPGGDEILAGNKTEPDSNTVMPVSAPEPPEMHYPAGEFEINRTRVIFASAGSSLLVLANQYGITLKHLVEFNELENENVLPVNQLLFLQRKRKLGSVAFHITRPGEDAYSISQAEGIRLESLLAFNQLERNMRPAAGSRIYLQQAAPSRPPLAGEMPDTRSTYNVPAGGRSLYHFVQAGQSLNEVAKQYGVTEDQIRDWNGLGQTGVAAGRKLIIYKSDL